jgi:hypothetical protein
MDQWEVCFVDLLNHHITYLTPRGFERTKIKKDKSIADDTREHATARLVARLGSEHWELTNGSGDYGPVLFFKRKLHPEG